MWKIWLRGNEVGMERVWWLTASAMADVCEPLRSDRMMVLREGSAIGRGEGADIFLAVGGRLLGLALDGLGLHVKWV